MKLFNQRSNEFLSYLSQGKPYPFASEGFQFRAIGTGKPRDFRANATMEDGEISVMFPRLFRVNPGQLPATFQMFSNQFRL